VSVALNLNPHQGFWLPLLAGNSWVLEVPLAPVPFHLRPDLYTKCLPFPHLSISYHTLFQCSMTVTPKQFCLRTDEELALTP
jgi:hypothetical protein